MIEIKPYESVGELNFGAKIDQALTLFGSPESESVNRYGTTELFYENYKLSFSAGSRSFKECLFYAGSRFILFGEEFKWSKEALSDLCAKDGKPITDNYVVALINLGLTVSGIECESERSLCAFERGLWDKHKMDMHSYKRPER